MDVRNDTTTSDGSLNEHVQLFVATNSKLQVSRRDAFHLSVV